MPDESAPTGPLPTRREVLIKGVVTTLALAGFGSKAGIALANIPGVTHGESPGLEEGPFWVDGQLERSNVRLDTSTNTYVDGLPFHLGLTISQLSDRAPYTISPLVGAKVDTWCCNPQGVYSDEANESTTGENYLRGYQITDAHGNIQFLTNYPGWYSGRTPHIHIRIRTYNAKGAVTYNYTTQFFFEESITTQVFNLAAYQRTTARDTYNATDRVFTGSSHNGSPETEAGDYMMLTMANDGTFIAGTFHIVVDLSDAANADPTNGVETTSGATGVATGGPGGGTPPGGGASIKANGVKSAAKSNTTSAAKSNPSSVAKPKPGTLRSKRQG